MALDSRQLYISHLSAVVIFFTVSSHPSSIPDMVNILII